jgi:imidazolonepropionase-like amidohydrolase
MNTRTWSRAPASFLLFLTSLLALAPCAWARERKATPIAIRGVTVIDVVEGRSLPAMTVIVRGEKIEAIGPLAEQKIPKDARVIDGTGRFLLPGLWDMHTHFTHDRSSLALFLAHGITAVRDMGSVAFKRVDDKAEYLPRDAALELIIQTRDDIRGKKLLGPTIFTGGMIVTGPNPNTPSDPPSPIHLVVKTPAEARATVNKLADLKVDFIKVHARLTRECFFTIMEEAKKRHLPVVGHVPLALNPIEVSEAGQKSIEHLTGVWEYAHQGLPDEDDRMDPKKFQAEIDVFKTNHTAQVPTLVNFQAPVEAHRIVQDFDSEPALDYVVPELALRWMGDWSKADFNEKMAKDFKDSVVTLQQMTLELSKNGVPILAGTDSGGVFTYPGISLHQELELLHQGGLSPMQTLQAATLHPAEFLGIADRTGSVSQGKLADLVLLRADPLLDIRNTDAIDAVLLHGELLDRARLDGLLSSVRQRAGTTRQLMKTLPWATPGQ